MSDMIFEQPLNPLITGSYGELEDLQSQAVMTSTDIQLIFPMKHFKVVTEETPERDVERMVNDEKLFRAKVIYKLHFILKTVEELKPRVSNMEARLPN